jgi:uncharacterized membrane protein YebE (DUF533 family)
MEPSCCGKVAKSLVIFGSGIALTACAYAAFRYWKRKDSKSIDEGFEDVSKVSSMKQFFGYLNLHTCHA